MAGATRALALVVGFCAAGCGSSPLDPASEPLESVAPNVAGAPALRPISFDFAHPNVCAQLPGFPPGVGCLPAGVAGGIDVVFVGDPLEGQVLALSRRTGKQIGV